MDAFNVNELITDDTSTDLKRFLAHISRNEK